MQGFQFADANAENSAKCFILKDERSDMTNCVQSYSATSSLRITMFVCKQRSITDKRIHPLFDEGAYVFARDIWDGFEEGMSRQKHLAPHVTLVLLGWGCTGQAQKLVENLQEGSREDSRNTKNSDEDLRLTLIIAEAGDKKRLVVSNLQHELHADPVFYQPHH